DAAMREAMNQIVCGLASGVRNGNLHVDVLAPRGNLDRLALHFRELVREHLERDRTVRHSRDYLFGELAVVRDAGLPHARRVPREPLYVRLAIKRHHAIELRAVAEDFRPKSAEIHVRFSSCRIQSAASVSDRTIASAFAGAGSSYP